MPSARTYRVLVVDDEVNIHDYVRDQLSRFVAAGDVEVLSARSEDEALERIDKRLVDLVVLDLNLGRGGDGLEVYNALADRQCSAEVILTTSLNLKDVAADLLHVVGTSSQPHIVDFLTKADLKRSIAACVQPRLTSHVGREVTVTGLEEAAAILLNRRDRYPDISGEGPGRLRASDDEVVVEVERLCRDLFCPTGSTMLETKVSVELRELGRLGLSAAITLRPLVRLSIDGLESRSDGYDCVLKLGPVADITDEYERYRDYVRYGVRLEQRVELLAYAARDAIAGIVYSFAGGVYGDDLVSLDELLQADPDRARDAISALYRSTHWYSTPASPGLIDRYFVRDPTKPDHMRDRLLQNYDQWKSLRRKAIHVMESAPETGSTTPSLFTVSGDPTNDPPSVIEFEDGTRLVLPSGRLMNTNWSFEPFPRCLVHGDMHGGNVLVELTTDTVSSSPAVQRVCLIDHRNSGPGPRCVDAAALEWSIRLADAEAIEREFGVEGERDIISVDVVEAMRIACRRASTERRLHHNLWHGGDNFDDEHWTALSSHLVRCVQTAFEPYDSAPLTAEEYSQTMVCYAIHQTGRRQRPVVRARLCAWLSAQFSFVPKPTN